MFILLIIFAILSGCTAIEERLYPKHITVATRLERKVAYHIFHVREMADGTVIEFYVLPKRLKGLPPEDDPQYQEVKLARRRAELQYFVELTLKEGVNAGYEHVHIHFSMPKKVILLDGRQGVTARTYIILRASKEVVIRYFEKEERDYKAYFTIYFRDYVLGWPWGIPFKGKANHWKADDAKDLDFGD